jgi:hypothetical protein
MQLDIGCMYCIQQFEGLSRLAHCQWRQACTPAITSKQRFKYLSATYCSLLCRAPLKAVATVAWSVPRSTCVMLASVLGSTCSTALSAAQHQQHQSGWQIGRCTSGCSAMPWHRLLLLLCGAAAAAAAAGHFAVEVGLKRAAAAAEATAMGAASSWEWQLLRNSH